MKRLIFTYMLPLMGILTGCSGDEIIDETPQVPEVPQQENPEFSASVSGFIDPDSRTELNGLDIWWQTADNLSIFLKTTEATTYILKDGAGNTTASFKAKAATTHKSKAYKLSKAPSALDHNVAIYPYATDYAVSQSETAYTVQNVEVPAEQTYAGNTFAPGTFPMVAASENTTLSFKNVCGLLKLQFKGKGTIKNISITGNNNEILAGKGTVTIAADGTPTLTMPSDGTKTVTLDCGTAGVSINDKEATILYLALPPVEFTKGFTIKITSTDGVTAPFPTSRANSIRRNCILKMPVLPVNMNTAQSNNEVWVKTSDNSKPIVPDGFTLYTNQINGHWVLLQETDITALPQETFQGQSAITAINLPATIQTIGSNAFAGTSITSLTIPENVTTIGQYILKDTPVLADLTINAAPGTLQTIHPLAFSERGNDDCRLHVSEAWKKDMSAFANGNFKDENGGAYIAVDATQHTISSTCPGMITRAHILSAVKAQAVQRTAPSAAGPSLQIVGPVNGTDFKTLREAAGCIFKPGDPVQEVLITALDLSDAHIKKGGLEYIQHTTLASDNTLGGYVFHSSSLTSIVLPADLQIIGESSLQASSLTSLHIPATVNRIEKFAFKDTQIGTLALPDRESLTIGKYGLAGIPQLTMLTIPANVVAVSDNFISETPLVQLKFDGAPTLSPNAFAGFTNSKLCDLRIQGTWISEVTQTESGLSFKGAIWKSIKNKEGVSIDDLPEFQPGFDL